MAKKANGRGKATIPLTATSPPTTNVAMLQINVEIHWNGRRAASWEHPWRGIGGSGERPDGRGQGERREDKNIDEASQLREEEEDEEEEESGGEGKENDPNEKEEEN